MISMSFLVSVLQRLKTSLMCLIHGPEGAVGAHGGDDNEVLSQLIWRVCAGNRNCWNCSDFRVA